MAKKTSSRKRAAPKKKRSASNKKQSPKTLRSKLAKIAFQLSIISVSLLLFWMIYLNAVVRNLFEGHRFKIPARVYSEAQELYVGSPVRRVEFLQLLDQLGYRKSDSPYQAGRYAVSASKIAVHTRGFRFWDGQEPSQILEIAFNEEGISRLTDPSGKSVLLARMDPLYLGQIYPGVAEDRVLYRLDEMPETLVLGLLLIEDDRFYSHWGVSIRGILRALFVNISTGRATQGGSTLTNQLVKNLYLTPEKTITRKINEALMSLILEFHYSKNDILETYMNEVYVGQQGARSINGFGLGAEFYFGTTLQSLELHQQAMLVGLIKGASFYNPRRNPERAKDRRNTILKVWHEQGLISSEDFNRATAQDLDIADKPGQAKYPAFMDSLRRQLARDYRKEDLLAEGLSIYTTLDPVAQQILENHLERGVNQAERNYGMPVETLQGAAVLTRPSTADVLAIVGDRDSKASGFNRALDAKRPVGSLMKPAVYLAAIEQGRTLAQTISDETVAVSARDGNIWQPKNYDKQNHGQPMLVDALAQSYNQATARLGMEIGLANVFDVIKRLGTEGDVPPVPAVMLGAHSMSPTQVAQMYQTIAGNGFYSPLNLIRAVSHPTLGVVQRFDLKVSKRFEPSDVHILQAAMHEATRSGTAARIQRQLPGSWWVAGKTGTTDDNRDAWFAGFTGDRQLVVWVGRDDNQPTPLTGSSGALPIWINVMADLDPLQERRGVPMNIEYIGVNSAGVNVPDWCDNVRALPFVVGTEPERGLSCKSNESKPETEKPTWWQKLFG
jgi:penicillin-binding protein 1B